MKELIIDCLKYGSILILIDCPIETEQQFKNYKDILHKAFPLMHDRLYNNSKANAYHSFEIFNTRKLTISAYIEELVVRPDNKSVGIEYINSEARLKQQTNIKLSQLIKHKII